MSEVYRIDGSGMSPYSVKAQRYCRYKGISHEGGSKLIFQLDWRPEVGCIPCSGRIAAMISFAT